LNILVPPSGSENKPRLLFLPAGFFPVLIYNPEDGGKKFV
jgi:hypothetical protein